MIATLIRGAALLAGVSGVAMPLDGLQAQLDSVRSQLATMAPPTPVSSNPASDAVAASYAQWKQLTDGPTVGFYDYATFLLAHPSWPGENAMRRQAESALNAGGWSPSLAVAYFRRFPPLTTQGGVRYAEALSATGFPAEAAQAARAAWVSGVLQPADEAKVLSNWGSQITRDDQDARMDMLLWNNSTSSAARQLPLVSPGKAGLFAARLAMRTKASDAAVQMAATQAQGMNDAGYLNDRALYLKNTNNWLAMRDLLAVPHNLSVRPADPEKWFETLLDAARGAANDGNYATAFAIARQVDDAYPAGTDVSVRSYGERDDYTSLVWLAGTVALKNIGRPGDAIGMFERYGKASRAPQTQSKGQYWAGRAALAAGRTAEANDHFTRAAGYGDQYYGQLASERLGRPLAPPVAMLARPVTAEDRANFYRKDTIRVAQYLGTIGDWQGQTSFIRQIALDAKSDSDHVLTAELSRTLNRPDLGVMVGRSALVNGLSDYSAAGFPTIQVPEGQADAFTIVHAIMRQESQFDRGAISRVGARGMMQLMPATARQTAGQLGLPYNAQQLTDDPSYNIQIGSSYFLKLYQNYGSYPLAIAAYNAGPGNVNKWLAANGDPRTGSADVIEWVEKIPLSETRNYVQRVLENAVVYDLMNPQRAKSRGPANLSWYLGKGNPG